MTPRHHPMPPPRRTILPLALATLALYACQTAPPIPPDPSVFGPTRPAETALTVDEARPFLARPPAGATASRRFEIMEGEHASRTRLIEVRSGADAILARTSLEGADAPESVQRLSIDDSGALVSTRTTNHDRDVITDFHPPLLIFPARLDPDTPATQSLEFIVRPIDDPSQIKQRGDAEVSITLVGRERVTLPDGPVDALHVRTTLHVNFGAAEVDRTTDQWLLPGGGLIAEAYDETVKVLGVPTEQHQATMRATSTPPLEQTTE